MLSYNFIEKLLIVLVIVMFSTSSNLYSQWPQTFKVDKQFTNYGTGPLAAVEDSSGGVYVVFGDWSWTPQGESIEMLFIHINKYGYIIQPEKKIEIIHNYADEAKIVHSSDGNLIIGFIDKEILEGHHQYRLKVALQKIDYQGTPLWENAEFIVEPDDTLQLWTFNLIPDDSGGCYVSSKAQKNGISNFCEFVQKISFDGKRVWGPKGITLMSSSNYSLVAPEIHLTKNNNLFVNTFANQNKYSLINLFNSEGVQLWQQKTEEGYQPIASYLNSKDQLTVLGLTGDISSEEGKLIAEVYNTDGSLVFNDPVVIIDSIDVNLTHRVSVIKSNDYIDLIYSYVKEISSQFVYQIITPELKPVYKSLGINMHGNRLFGVNEDTIILDPDNAKLFRYNVDGHSVWDSTGLNFSIANICLNLPVLTSDENDGVIVLWMECLKGMRGKQINKFGEFGRVLTAANESNYSHNPNDYYISNNYPNPFNPSTKIEYSIPASGNVLLKVFDILGNEIKTLVNEFKTVGKYEVEFEAGNLASGVYFYKITAGSYTVTKKMALIR